MSLGFDFAQVATATMVLFAVIDILGSVPLIIEIRKKAGEIFPMKATMVSLLIMVAFLFLGESILKIIGINVNAFAVAGSFVLFLMGIEMILGVRLFREEEGNAKAASIVPLAFPIIAGAGTMTTILSLRAELFYLCVPSLKQSISSSLLLSIVCLFTWCFVLPIVLNDYWVRVD